jgi:hypothetical protein
MSKDKVSPDAAIALGIAAADDFLSAFLLPPAKDVSNGAASDIHDDGTPARPDAPRLKDRKFDF